MDRQPFAMRLRDHLPAYAQPVAALSRIASPLFRALPPGYRVEMHRPGQLTLTTNVGDLRIRFDLAAQPALESIALDPEPRRRVALANLYLQPWFDTLQPYLAAYGVDTPIVDDLVPADDRLAVTVGLSVACRLPEGTDGEDSAAATPEVFYDDGAFLCIVEALSPSLVEAFAARHAGEAPSAATLLNRLDGIAIPTRLRLTSRRYKVSTLRSLRHGDVLLGWPWQYAVGASAAETGQDDAESAPRIGGHWLWGAAGQRQCRHPVYIDENSIHIIDRPDMTDDRIDLHHPDAGTDHLDFAASGAHAESLDDDARDTYSDEADAADADTTLLNDVDLMVHIEIGCVAMPAAELARVRPGYILTLPEKISNAAVNLVVSGRTVATGELVAVGDQLGVRVHRNGHAHG
ncbi:type III secretion system cytoplasmic ring protein SctQ [Robbsia sp. KACC 23696]|uniref:type III secretion system cytoplasmic ring protein SctQ n=1 Tax=Robbsia sp. KACC 23696 TaxID=3149231 RepID=UPI00325B41D1